MDVTDQDRFLLAAIEGGLSLEERPFAEIADRLGWSEQRVIERLGALIEEGAIKRFGVVVRHRALGYRANAMVVFDIPDAAVAAAGAKLAALPFVTLCYRRPRRLPAWPFNLFCMIHGRDESEVRTQVDEAAAAAGIADAPRDVLFSRRCFKQRGARYRREAAA
ncbi:MAG: Lrp/AsnC family transcriptional regulator [Rhizobiales bacterium]|nr:Lrp/AsnC family transcriptional regulator [Hyphomicrobiales bacterium]